MQMYFCVFYRTDHAARCILCSAEAADVTPGAHVWYQLVCYTKDKQWAVNARIFFFSLRTITQHTSLDWKRNADMMLWPDVCVFVPIRGFLPWFIRSNWACVEKHVLVCVCVLCGRVCGFMYLREHHFKTNSLQRKQSPLDRHKVSMSNIWTKKKSYLCYESYAPAIRYCRCYSWCSWRSLWVFSRLGVWSLSLLCSFSGTLNTEGG